MNKRPDNPSAAAGSGGNSRPRAPGDSKSPAVRIWLNRLVALVLVPLLSFGVLEGALRLFGFGYSTAFFTNVRVNGTKFVANNNSFSLRFFPPQLTRWPAPIMMRAAKPPDTCRIFIMGESAAMGDPQIAYGAGRYLEAMLNEASPGKHFEVINVAITAINSNVILPIAHDCARQNGDLWIIYMGNNEMVGPFGAATVFGAQAPRLPLIRLTLAIQQTRIGQLIANLSRKISATAAPAAWSGMEMFLGNQLRFDDPRKETVYHNFEANLRDILRAGLDSGAGILLNTVAVNLKDCPPFGSLTNAALPSASRAQYDSWYSQACQSQENGALTLAAQSFEQAARLDPDEPNLQYRWGQCLAGLTNFPAALEHFQQACDLDTLPFRADSRINGLIKNAARQYAGDRLALFDAATDLAAANKLGITGKESFYEHVHFNFDGNYRLASAWAAKIQPLLPPSFRNDSGNWASREICDHRLGLTDWNRYTTLGSVLRRLRQPPFNNQLGNARRIGEVQDQMREIRARMTPAAATAARKIYLDALKRAPGDHFLHENFAAFLTATGDFEQAVATWRQVHELVPQDFTVFSRIGGLLAQQGKWSQAESFFHQAVTLYPAFGPGWLGLGETHAAEGNTALALEEYDRALRLDPREARAYYDIGAARSKLNHSAEAIQSFRMALDLDPDDWEAHFALGVELGSRDQVPEAQREFEQVIQLNPDDADAHLNLAVALMRQNRMPQAQSQIEETLRLDPTNATARQYLGQIRRNP